MYEYIVSIVNMLYMCMPHSENTTVHPVRIATIRCPRFVQGLGCPETVF